MYTRVFLWGKLVIILLLVSNYENHWYLGSVAIRDNFAFVVGFFSMSNWASRYQKGILMKQHIMGWQWHQLDHMQIIHT